MRINLSISSVLSLVLIYAPRFNTSFKPLSATAASLTTLLSHESEHTIRSSTSASTAASTKLLAAMSSEESGGGHCSNGGGRLLVSIIDQIGEDENNANQIRLVLASQSPRRREILDMMGLSSKYTARPSPLVRRFLNKNETIMIYKLVNIVELSSISKRITHNFSLFTLPTFLSFYSFYCVYVHIV